MIRFFENEQRCHIVLEPSLLSSDVEVLELLLNKDHLSWHIEFGRLYSINRDILDLLYREIFENLKNISITTHKSKLNRYLHRLGFSTVFSSLLKKDVVKISDVKVVLIGGSADSSSKIMQIVKNTDLSYITLVVVQHVEANREGIFDEILQKYTKHKVAYAKDKQMIKRGFIYLAPNDRHLLVEDGYFVLSDAQKYNFSKPSVSISYESFSAYYKEELLVIQECGYASDGVDKLEMLKQKNSKLIIQNIDECEAKPMVQNALNLNMQDYTLSLNEIVAYINLINKKSIKSEWIEYLLDMIYIRYNYNFKLYHLDMIERRIEIFMLKHEIKNIKDAVGIILYNRSAFKSFFLEISINVTEFFRKPESFNRTIEILNKHYKKANNIKIWSAGCSSGEESYSMAMVLARLNLLKKSIIYATDFNAPVLEEAKIGAYSKESYELAKDNLLEIDLEITIDNYLTKNSNYITINEKIKEKILFFQHNLIEDSSFNEFDIIICKNVIIYFDMQLQMRVFKLFYDSLKFGGYLILGESESIIEMFKNNFEQSFDDCKIYRKVA